MKFSAHVVDSTFGVPASDVEISLRRQQNAEWQHVANGHTDATGQLADWSRREFQHGTYQIEITIDSYYAITGITPLYSRITAEFHVFVQESHLHLGILIATNSFQIYRETRESMAVAGELAPRFSGAPPWLEGFSYRCCRLLTARRKQHDNGPSHHERYQSQPRQVRASASGKGR